ncbi:esterase/lipase family protein [Rugamonas rubra]|uniref:Triacylglycerol esterase/lipase EstA, alpha/beta hydrolase fold n=1 Tax=Rugamonas rubra TaxID=758825 RepID=A0A1I4NGS5_9BURK|nr:alpha/beta fold hydrolase [Rugamonas rubra]SFM14734.1 Triacylglycerol esterase/lipase EstA, alpha/beta hydrolase fold [Rugamonas rubra]
MIRRLLAWLLAVQALAALALAWGLWRGAGWQPAAALAAGVGAVLAVRLAINLNNFRLSRRWRSAVPAEFQLGPAAALRLCWREFAASLRSSSWDMLLPSPMWLAPAPPAVPATAAPAAPPVLLLHGYACNGGYWRRLGRQLRRAGISHYALDLAPPGAAIDQFVPQVRAAVAMLCARTGAPQVVLLGHSMGGLVARSYLRADGPARVARLITLGSPHHGTALARLGPGANAAQMRHGGAWLAALARAEAAEAAGAAGAGVTVVSLFSHHDNIVAPQDSARLAGARNLAFGAVGHVALGSDASVMQCVLAEIAACAPPRGAMDSAGRLR